MVEKYIIDKADIHNLLTGKEIPLEHRSKARAFCVEIPGEMTTGEIIKALIPNAVIRTDDSRLIVEVLFSNEVWNAPYKAESEE